MKTNLLPIRAVACALAVTVSLATAWLPASAQTAPLPTAANAGTSGAAPSDSRAVGAPTAGSKPGRIVAGSISEDSQPTQGEPNVKRTVIEDHGSRIEELKVRGQTRRITVTPKVNAKLQYEVLPDDNSGFGDSAASSTPHGKEGRRVWNVLAF